MKYKMYRCNYGYYVHEESTVGGKIISQKQLIELQPLKQDTEGNLE